MRVIGWGEVSRRHHDGQFGARAHVRAEGHWPARYHVDTHGKNPRDVAAAMDDLDVHHAAWVTRLEALLVGQGAEFTLAGATYRVVDLTLPPVQPGSRARVLVGVVELLSDGKTRKVDGFPSSLWYNSFQDIPEPAEIIEIVRQQIGQRADAAAAHATFQQHVANEVQRRRG